MFLVSYLWGTTKPREEETSKELSRVSRTGEDGSPGVGGSQECPGGPTGVTDVPAPT